MFALRIGLLAWMAVANCSNHSIHIPESIHGMVSVADAGLGQLRVLSVLEEPDDTTVKFNCSGLGYEAGDCPPYLAAFVDYLLLSVQQQLTGFRAFIPIFVVAVGEKSMADSFPLRLENGFWWVSTWPSIVFFGALVLVEATADLIPGAAEIIDAVMLMVKPLASIFITVAMAEGDSVALKIWSVAQGMVLAFAMAIAKAQLTLLITTTTLGVGTPLRSLFETALVGLLCPLCLFFIGIAVPVLLVGFVVVILVFCFVLKKGVIGPIQKVRSFFRGSRSVESSHQPRFASLNKVKDRDRCCDMSCWSPRYRQVQPRGHQELEVHDTDSHLLC